jgi:hypothetical protein
MLTLYRPQFEASGCLAEQVKVKVKVKVKEELPPCFN